MNLDCCTNLGGTFGWGLPNKPKPPLCWSRAADPKVVARR